MSKRNELTRAISRGRTLCAVGALAGAIAVASDAGAASMWPSDCTGGAVEQDNFNPGDEVCVSGDVDVVPPGSVFGEADIYVIPPNFPFPFFDVTKGGFNHIATILGAGAYIDEEVWLPITIPGKWELVMDQYPFFSDSFAPFDPNVDMRGVFFTVDDVPVVFSCDPAAIKAAAKIEEDHFHQIHNFVVFYKVLNLVALIVKEWDDPAKLTYELFCKAVKAAKLEPECPEMPWDWSKGKAIEILAKIGESMELHYNKIWADPPDPNYMTVVAPDQNDLVAAGGPWASPIDNEFSNRIVKIAQLFAVQATAYNALVPTMEKLQGAQLATGKDDHHLGMLIQAEKLKEYTGLAIQAGDQLSTEVDGLESYLMQTGDLDMMTDGSPYQQAIADIMANGLSSDDAALLQNLGATDSMLAAAKDELAQTALPASFSLHAMFDELKKGYSDGKAALTDLHQQAENMRNENAALSLRWLPQITSVTSPGPGKVGNAMTLSAAATSLDPSAMLSFFWDTNLDGKFDDGTGASIQFTPKVSGPTLVNVKVTDQNGLEDVSTLLVTADATNSPPEITAITPDDGVPVADVGAMVAFHVDATDKDGDALTYTWSVDGVQAGMGQDFAFTMPDASAHSIRVIVSDTDPYSPDAEAIEVVHAQAGTATTGPGSGTESAGAGGAGSGSGSGAGGGIGEAPRGTSSTGGCACSVPGNGGDTSGAWLATALLGLAIGRRRRRG